jgi:hypothetical protein
MSIIGNFRKALFRSDPIDQRIQPTEPVAIGAAQIIGGQLQEAIDLRSRKDRYSLADNFVNSDERLFSMIELMAVMVQKAVGEFTLRPEDADDQVTTRSEKRAVAVANELHRKLNIPRLFYRYTKDLWKYGDAVDQIKFGKGIEDLIPLPLFVVSAVDKRSQIGKTGGDFVISDPKYYAVDEQDGKTDINTQIIRHDRVFHVSFDNKRSWIKDNLGRWTFNVWSIAPINSLMGILMWKKILMNNDQTWRNRALPREWHKLDLTPFDPSKYQGTHTEKLEASKTDAEKAINSYTAVNAQRSADQGFVTGKNVEIEYVEPKSTTYADPSPIIDQINALIGGPSGAPPALLGGSGETGGFTSLVHASSFIAMRAEVYLDGIREMIEKLVRRHINMIEPSIKQEIVDRVILKTRLILDRDRAELAKIIAVLAGARAFTTSEIRAIWGLDPMTEEQEEALKEWIASTQNPGAGLEGEKSPDRAEADLLERGTGEGSRTGDQQSPAQRDRNELTRGDRAGGS